MSTLQEHLANELGDLPPQMHTTVTTYLGDLLRALGCQDQDPATLQDPGEMSTRDRLVSYLDQISPNLWDGPHGPEVERTLNAILLYTYPHLRTESTIGTMMP